MYPHSQFATMIKRISGLSFLWLALQVLKADAYIPSVHPSQQQQQQQQTIGKGYASPLFRERQAIKTVPLASVLQINPLCDRKKEAFQRNIPENPVQFSTKYWPSQRRQYGQAEHRKNQRERRQHYFISSSAALAGFTDVLCLSKYGCFVNMMTGNILKATTALVESHNLSFRQIARNGDIWIPASFVVSYMLGVIIFGQLQDFASRKILDRDGDDDEEQKLAPLRVVAPLVAVLFLGADRLALGHTAQKAIQVPLLAMGFGIINCAAAQATASTIFFAMTGHLTKITNSMRQHTFSNQKVWDPDAATVTSIRVLKGFTCGAILAAIIIRCSNHLLPVCTVLGLLYASLFAWYTRTAPVAATKIYNLHRSIRLKVFQVFYQLQQGRLVSFEK